jgi:hypothetical protein
VVDGPKAVPDVGVQHPVGAPVGLDPDGLKGWWAERLGRNPKLDGRKSASKIGSTTSFAAVIATRSRTVGTVASNCPPCG